jgi:hypothetical protein
MVSRSNGVLTLLTLATVAMYASRRYGNQVQWRLDTLDDSHGRNVPACVWSEVWGLRHSIVVVSSSMHPTGCKCLFLRAYR